MASTRIKLFFQDSEKYFLFKVAIFRGEKYQKEYYLKRISGSTVISIALTKNVHEVYGGLEVLANDEKFDFKKLGSTFLWVRSIFQLNKWTGGPLSYFSLQIF